MAEALTRCCSYMDARCIDANYYMWQSLSYADHRCPLLWTGRRWVSVQNS